MAPTPDELVQALQGTVDKLENRVAELEARLKGQPTGGRSTARGGDGLRMILIGPPGAGALSSVMELSCSVKYSYADTCWT